MSNSGITLEQIQIRKPCPVSWDQMAGDEKVRFCVHCKMNVFDLSAMDRDEAERFINQRAGGAAGSDRSDGSDGSGAAGEAGARTCVRMYRRMDGMVVTADCEVVRLRLARRVYTKVAAGIALLFAMGAGALWGGTAAIRKANEIGLNSGRSGPWIFAKPAAPPVRMMMGDICAPASSITTTTKLIPGAETTAGSSSPFGALLSAGPSEPVEPASGNDDGTVPAQKAGD